MVDVLNCGIADTAARIKSGVSRVHPSDIELQLPPGIFSHLNSLSFLHNDTMSYSLSVSIDPGVLPLLLRNGYKLCLARKVNSTYDVVWQAVS